MRFRDWLLNEMPINIQKVGQWGEKDPMRGYDRRDIGIMQRGIDKIKQKWGKVEQNFNTWVCRSAQCFKVREVGMVDEDYVRDVLKLKIVPSPKNPDEINIDPNSINYIVVNNKGDQKVPLTAWTLAHRFGHVLNAGSKKIAAYEYFVNEFWRDIRWFFENVYEHKLEVRQYKSGNFALDGDAGNILRSFFHQIGTMKSARERNIRNAGEFAHELFAQYIITGQIKFNPLPKSIKYFKNPDTNYYQQEKPRGHWSYLSSRMDPSQFEEYSEHLQEHLAEMTKTNIEHTLSQCVGKIFVM